MRDTVLTKNDYQVCYTASAWAAAFNTKAEEQNAFMEKCLNGRFKESLKNRMTVTNTNISANNVNRKRTNVPCD